MTATALPAAGELAAGDELPSRCVRIEVYVSELSQLFNEMDPSPFRDRDLDPSAESFIVGWAREANARAQLALLVHVDRPTDLPAGAPSSRMPCTSSSCTGPRRRGNGCAGSFREGRTSLAIGLVFLALATIGGQLLADALVEWRVREPADRESPHRRLGRDVAAAPGVPLRLVADPRRGEAVRPAAAAMPVRLATHAPGSPG